MSRKFVQTTGKLVRTSGTRSVCFTGSDVFERKKQTTIDVNNNNRDFDSDAMEHEEISRLLCLLVFRHFYVTAFCYLMLVQVKERQRRIRFKNNININIKYY